MGVKLSGSLPQDFDSNGMERLHAELVRHPERRHVVVMVVDCVRTTVDHSGGDRYTPTAGILFVEPITDEEDSAAVLDIMGRVRAERCNDGTIDFDFGVAQPSGPVAFDARRVSGDNV